MVAHAQEETRREARRSKNSCKASCKCYLFLKKKITHQFIEPKRKKLESESISRGFRGESDDGEVRSASSCLWGGELNPPPIKNKGKKKQKLQLDVFHVSGAVSICAVWMRSAVWTGAASRSWARSELFERLVARLYLLPVLVSAWRLWGSRSGLKLWARVDRREAQTLVKWLRRRGASANKHSHAVWRWFREPKTNQKNKNKNKKKHKSKQ